MPATKSALRSSGTEALQLLRQALADKHPFEVVLADYQMHDMDGAALGERINADPQLVARAHGDAHVAWIGTATFVALHRSALPAISRSRCARASCSSAWIGCSRAKRRNGTCRASRSSRAAALVSDDAARRYEGHVLLVEDNAVNQKVAVRFLERMGCNVRVADNGAEGVKAYQDGALRHRAHGSADAGDGRATATRRIREIEGAGERPHTPIVALTANAMTGQLERCMEAGMNGFLTKPLEIARLHETFDRFGLGVGNAGPLEASVMSSSPATPVDLARLNEITDGDAEFAHELASTFVASGEQVLHEIHAALATFDRTALGRAAHKLKGASANIHAEHLRDLAYSLETQAGQLDQPRLKELVEQLQNQFYIAAEFLQASAPAPAAQAG